MIHYPDKMPFEEAMEFCATRNYLVGILKKRFPHKENFITAVEYNAYSLEIMKEVTRVIEDFDRYIDNLF